MKAILASQNAHKAQEFACAVNGLEIVAAPHAVEVDENADTFAGNSRLKARAYAREFGTNALADDSGLCVDALGGAPGVHSQRFAVIPPDIDEDPDRTAANNRKLLRHLDGVPSDKRTAYFACALCLVVVEADDVAFCKTHEQIRNAAKFFDASECEVTAQSPNVVSVEIAVEGHAHGRILEQSAGNGGFGYDPLFYCPETQSTFAQLTAQQKLTVSHRGRAIALLRELFE